MYKNFNQLIILYQFYYLISFWFCFCYFSICVNLVIILILFRVPVSVAYLPLYALCHKTKINYFSTLIFLQLKSIILWHNQHLIIRFFLFQLIFNLSYFNKFLNCLIFFANLKAFLLIFYSVDTLWFEYLIVEKRI